MSTSELTEKVKQLKELQSLIEDAEQEAEALKDAIKAHMQENGVEECRAGMFKVRWSKVKSSRFDTTAFGQRTKSYTANTCGRRKQGGSALYEKSPLYQPPSKAMI